MPKLPADALAEKSGSQSTHNINFRIAEAYRTIRTNLLFTLANKENHMVIFTSAEPGAGKSTLCSNLAILMAQTGAHVLLIDTDMRKPVQHRNFRLRKSEGLSKILSGLADVQTCLNKEVSPNLDLIVSGPIPPNPSELLGSDQMMKLMEWAEKEYDYIFLDMPPLSVVTDALVATPMAAGVVLVARQRQTTYDELGECVSALEQAKANLLGVVITDAKEEKSAYGLYDRKRYYRSYNYVYKEKA